MVILFNDALVVWSQISLSVFPLRLLWISEFSDAKKLTIKLPEEEVSFSFPSQTERDHWSSLIVSTVSKGMGSETNDILPPTRSADYTFKAELNILKAKYPC